MTNNGGAGVSSSQKRFATEKYGRKESSKNMGVCQKKKVDRKEDRVNIRLPKEDRETPHRQSCMEGKDIRGGGTIQTEIGSL